MDGQDKINGQAPGTEKSTIESCLSLSEYMKSYFEFIAIPIPDDALNAPLASEIMSPLSTDAMLDTRLKGQASGEPLEAQQEHVPRIYKLASIGSFWNIWGMALSFHIDGIFLRYGLQVLFGDVVVFTSDRYPLYNDLPANILGSFIMGWFAFGFKPSILEFSELLALGLTTGCWIQRMLNLTTHGQWVVGILGLPLGNQQFMDSCFEGKCQVKIRRLERNEGLVLVMLALIWGAKHFPYLWLACLVGPPGVWTRWFLNGRALKGNVRLRFEKTESSQTVIEGIQLGFLGYMITVSAFVAEVYCLIESGHIWRVFGYMILSIGLSFGLGTLVYSTCLDQGLLFY
ncbi:hypothetical protein AMTRI_Chr12g235270 [Amborella trichopoda]